MASASRTSAAFRGEAFRSTSVMAFVRLMPDHVAEISRSLRSKVCPPARIAYAMADRACEIEALASGLPPSRPSARAARKADTVGGDAGMASRPRRSHQDLKMLHQRA